MKMSESIAHVATALSKAQGMIDDATKTGLNPAFKSKYADLAAVRAVIREPLAVNDLAIVQGPRRADGGVEVEIAPSGVAEILILDGWAQNMGQATDAVARHTEFLVYQFAGLLHKAFSALDVEVFVPQECLVQAAVHGDDLAGGFAEELADEEEVGFGLVSGVDRGLVSARSAPIRAPRDRRRGGGGR